MRSTSYLLTAACSLAALSLIAHAATRPRYGGTLRLEMQAAVLTLDPTEASPDGLEFAARENLESLVFERLVRLDEDGRPQPSLAASWESAQGGRRWLFHLRSGVKFHDGSPVTPIAVASALSTPENGWDVGLAPDGVRIRSERPLPELLYALADVHHSIVLRAPDGTLSGTGPFRIAEWQAGRHALLKANEDYWGGRPFLDAVSIELARTPRQQMLDLELGKADVVELAANESRRGVQGNAQAWTSAPVQLLAVVFERGRAATEDARLREALALSMDRAAIHTVLLQKQGEPAGSLLPQWLSGCSFLFLTARDLVRARQLVSALPPAAVPLTLGYDSFDSAARAIADRIAVNAREIGIRLQVTALASRPDMRIARLRLRSGGPGQALAALASALQMQDSLSGVNLSDPEARYTAERAMLDENRVIPLVHLPEAYAARSTVRSWMTEAILKTGEWRIDAVWLGPERP